MRPQGERRAIKVEIDWYGAVDDHLLTDDTASQKVLNRVDAGRVFGINRDTGPAGNTSGRRGGAKRKRFIRSIDDLDRNGPININPELVLVDGAALDWFNDIAFVQLNV